MSLLMAQQCLYRHWTDGVWVGVTSTQAWCNNDSSTAVLQVNVHSIAGVYLSVYKWHPHSAKFNRGLQQRSSTPLLKECCMEPAYYTLPDMDMFNLWLCTGTGHIIIAPPTQAVWGAETGF